MAYYGGIEGGTTGSRMVILRADGKQVGKSEGPHTNYWHLGMSEAAHRIVLLVKDALQNADLPVDTPLKSLGLALSGINTELNSMQMIEAVRRINPNVAERIHACNDAVGTLVTATDENAIVLIAGTGSICKLIRKDLSFVRIGGLGYLLGDEGSAFWIAHQAIMSYIKTTEGLYYAQYGTQRITEAIYKHFGIKHYHELLSHFNENIDKTFIAQLCKYLAEGFRSGLKPQHCGDCQQGRINLRLLHITAAVGAAILAAKLECGISIPRPDQVTDFLCEISLAGYDSQRDP
ncbi:N-acetylglucosamine kinase [Paragonimus westermani]|uniref:N-acetyl-D-glucosamine kinase n=1 Tax=Paragonimus westermani TaxID=34504 RepID=A0A5J4P1X6_9TREM|nr:N-acetylglucosamine kinase [Paragonimus westermani]